MFSSEHKKVNNVYLYFFKCEKSSPSFYLILKKDLVLYLLFTRDEGMSNSGDVTFKR